VLAEAALAGTVALLETAFEAVPKDELSAAEEAPVTGGAEAVSDGTGIIDEADFDDETSTFPPHAASGTETKAKRIAQTTRFLIIRNLSLLWSLRQYGDMADQPNSFLRVIKRKI
jgi:hypothetical protein